MAEETAKASPGWKTAKPKTFNPPSDFSIRTEGSSTLIRWSDTNKGRAVYRLQREKQLADGSWGETVDFHTPKGATSFTNSTGDGVFRWRAQAVAP